MAGNSAGSALKPARSAVDDAKRGGELRSARRASLPECASLVPRRASGSLPLQASPQKLCVLSHLTRQRGGARSSLPDCASINHRRASGSLCGMPCPSGLRLVDLDFHPRPITRRARRRGSSLHKREARYDLPNQKQRSRHPAPSGQFFPFPCGAVPVKVCPFRFPPLFYERRCPDSPDS